MRLQQVRLSIIVMIVKLLNEENVFIRPFLHYWQAQLPTFHHSTPDPWYLASTGPNCRDVSLRGNLLFHSSEIRRVQSSAETSRQLRVSDERHSNTLSGLYYMIDKVVSYSP